MANFPASYDDKLRGGTPEEFKTVLGALFKVFPSRDDGSSVDRAAGYIEVLRGEPAWAAENAVRKFVHGKIPSHDGRFLPTAAELAKAVRQETEWYRNSLSADRRVSRTREIIADVVADMSPEAVKRRKSQVQKALAGFDIPARPSDIYKQDPTYLRFREVAEKSRKKHNRRSMT